MEFEERIKQQYDECISRVNRVYGIFKDFFGEERVDLQNLSSETKLMDLIKSRNTEEILGSNVMNLSNEEWTTYKRLHIEELPQDVQDNIFAHYNVVKLATVPLATSKKPFILVWFPHVTVTNEHDRSTEIDNLYAKIVLEYDGTISGRFSLNRATYTLQHISSNYMHSHVGKIPFDNLTAFQVPCTGTGPINSTISSLCNEFDEDIWNLFCLELSKYVTVESISGTPYNYLEHLGTYNMTESPSTYTAQSFIPPMWFLQDTPNGRRLSADFLGDFMSYIVGSKKLKYGYSDYSYVMGMPYIKVVATVSNLFIEWYNKKFNEYSKTMGPLPEYGRLLERGILLKCKFANNKLYTVSSNNTTAKYTRYIGKHVCTFKGKEITVNISDIQNIHENETIILNPSIISFIVWRILETLNYEYGNKDRRREREEASKASGEDRAIKGRWFI